MRTFATTRARRSCCAAAGALLLAAAAGAQAPDPLQNGALFHWKALAVMQSPQSREEVDLVSFMDRELDPLPPRAFAYKPDALRWLLNERPMLAALNDGARRTVCVFSSRTLGEATLDLSHVARLRQLALRALAAAKAYEYVDNAPGAARIYADLLRLARQLDQDNNLTSGLLGAELLQKLLWELEGFFSRVQPGDAVVVLTREFKDGRAPVFHPGNYLRDEAQRYGDWLLADPRRMLERLGRLYGNAASRPAVEQLVTLEESKKIQRLRAWVEDYRKRMKAVADAVDLPFAEGMPRVRGLDALKTAAQRDRSGKQNPLISLLVPEATPIYERFLLAEGHFDAVDVLCQAALFRADSGEWPARIEEIGQFCHRELPKDPFSGEKFFYELSRGYPEVSLRIPKKMASREILYSVSLAHRRAEDEERLKVLVKNAAQETRESVNTPVPLR